MVELKVNDSFCRSIIYSTPIKSSARKCMRNLTCEVRSSLFPSSVGEIFSDSLLCLNTTMTDFFELCNNLHDCSHIGVCRLIASRVPAASSQQHHVIHIVVVASLPEIWQLIHEPVSSWRRSFIVHIK